MYSRCCPKMVVLHDKVGDIISKCAILAILVGDIMRKWHLFSSHVGEIFCIWSFRTALDRVRVSIPFPYFHNDRQDG